MGAIMSQVPSFHAHSGFDRSVRQPNFPSGYQCHRSRPDGPAADAPLHRFAWV